MIYTQIVQESAESGRFKLLCKICSCILLAKTLELRTDRTTQFSKLLNAYKEFLFLVRVFVARFASRLSVSVLTNSAFKNSFYPQTEKCFETKRGYFRFNRSKSPVKPKFVTVRCSRPRENKQERTYVW